MPFEEPTSALAAAVVPPLYKTKVFDYVTQARHLLLKEISKTGVLHLVTLCHAKILYWPKQETSVHLRCGYLCHLALKRCHWTYPISNFLLLLPHLLVVTGLSYFLASQLLTFHQRK